MSADYIPRLSWEGAFLESLAKLKNIKRSALAAGVTTGAVYSQRKNNPAFLAACEAAMAAAVADGWPQPVRNAVKSAYPQTTKTIWATHIS